MAAAFLAVVLLSSACGKPGETTIRADVPRAATTGATSTAAAAGIDALAADLYGQLAPEAGNFLFSPYSVEIALGMTRQGARGETRSQMDAVLRAGSGDDLDRSLNLLDQELAKRPGAKGDDTRRGDVELSTANALFAQKDTPFEQPFLTQLASMYGAGVRLVDYKSAPNPAREEINRWAADRTHDKIVDLLPPGSLDSFTRLVLTNAIYFKAPWAKRFQPAGDQPFTKADGASVTAPAMSTSKIGSYREGAGWKAAEIPYLGDELSMLVVVPDQLAAFESSLSGSTLATIVGTRAESLATLQMPKFTFRSEVPLKAQLSALGMPLAFSDQADLSGMTNAEPLRIADVYHQAFIAVDEEGTEAAAATAVVVEAVSGPCCKSLVVDKPFLFAVRDVATGAVLFLGRVTDPSAR